MARLDRMSQAERDAILAIPCPTFPSTPWQPARPLADCRVAIVSTAGLHLRDDRPFALTAGGPGGLPGDYRVIPTDSPARELVMSHVSVNFDRSGWQRDWNLVLPLDRLRELAAAGAIGSVAAYHYSFMGAAPPDQLEAPARRLARLLAGDGVDLALLVPV
ncbi:MAG: glycine/sarcosine/betaine reductase selenoprotein B family protein [Thermoleophilia bacterium]